MQIPEKLLARLEKLGLSGDIYSKRTRKCILSKESLNLEKVPWYEYAYFIGDNFSSFIDLCHSQIVATGNIKKHSMGTIY